MRQTRPWGMRHTLPAGCCVVEIDHPYVAMRDHNDEHCPELTAFQHVDVRVTDPGIPLLSVALSLECGCLVVGKCQNGVIWNA